jgi:8-oxo-dGTP pyrophosphatase MutT (NUDIX family)
MAIVVPEGARPAARVLMLDTSDRVLYLHAREQRSGHEFWVMPGGGLEAGESFEAAAIREAHEETGLQVRLLSCIWTRHHIYEWEGRAHNQFEVFFLARTNETAIRPPSSDSYVVGYRWWSLAELEESDESFAPTQIATLLPPILQGRLPSSPIECGV